MAKDKICSACGDKSLRNNLCKKHWQQKLDFGFVLDDIPETKTNEIVELGDTSELVIFNDLGVEVARVTLDTEDIETIKNYTWEKSRQSIITKDVTGKTISIANMIMYNLEEKVNYVNGDYLDNRKENLQVLPKRKKKRKQLSIPKKHKNKIIVEFVGKSHEQVTGSAILVSIPTKEDTYRKILVEFGGSQMNRDLYHEYLANKEIVENVPCNEIEYAFVLHNHYDHIANLPALIPNGFNGKVISNKENAALLQPMLLDGAFIMSKNIKSINSKKRNVEPLYTESDVYLLLNKIDQYSMNEIHKLDDTISFQFVRAGHILGSCQLVLYIKTPTGQIKKIHITSDLGSSYNIQPFVPEKDIVTSSNVSIFETTYNDLDRGFKTKKEVQKERDKLKTLIKRELKNKRNILIGAFAQSRTQNLMCYLYECFKDDEEFKFPIYIDGVLSLELNNVYLKVLEGEEKEYWREVMNWKNFHYISSFENSQQVALNKDEISLKISSGGMFSQGRILNHLKTMVEDKRSTIVLCGYQGEGTVGHELQRKETKTVKIEGLEYNKRCKIVELKTWSSHIQAEENIKYMSQVKTSMIILHHSSNEKHEFRDIVEDELRKRNNTAKITCADENNNIFYI